MSLSFGRAWVASRPSISTRPEETVSIPAIIRSRVDLPQPEGPTRTRNSPSAISSETRWTASALPPGKVLVTSCSAIRPTWPPLGRPVCSLDGPGGQPACQVALEEGEDQERRDHREQQAGADDPEVLFEVALELGDADHDRAVAFRLQDHEAEEELVPEEEEVQGHQGEEARPHQRHDHRPEGA